MYEVTLLEKNIDKCYSLLNVMQTGVNMTSAYIMIKSSPGSEGDIYAKITKINGVRTAHTITGPYDLIAFVEAGSLDLLGKTVISKIQNLKGITDTMTCVVVDPM